MRPDVRPHRGRARPAWGDRGPRVATSVISERSGHPKFGMSFVRHSPAPSDEGQATPPAREGAPGAPDALAPARRGREDALLRPPARRIERALRAAPRGLTAQELAEAVGRHHTGVRAQLAELERCGVVEARVDPSAGRGRPPRRATILRHPIPPSARRPGTGSSCTCSCRSSGRPDSARPRSSASVSVRVRRSPGPGRGKAELGGAFERLGFAPRDAEDGHPGDLILHRCPFADGVEAPNGQLICLLHRGLARGIARSRPRDGPAGPRGQGAPAGGLPHPPVLAGAGEGRRCLGDRPRVTTCICSGTTSRGHPATGDLGHRPRLRLPRWLLDSDRACRRVPPRGVTPR